MVRASGQRAQTCYAGTRDGALILSIPDRKHEGYYLQHYRYPMSEAEDILGELRRGRKPRGMGKGCKPADLINLAQALAALLADLQGQGQNSETRK